MNLDRYQKLFERFYEQFGEVRDDSPLEIRYNHLLGQVDILGKFLLEHFDHEIGGGPDPGGEGACELVVRLLQGCRAPEHRLYRIIGQPFSCPCFPDPS